MNKYLAVLAALALAGCGSSNPNTGSALEADAAPDVADSGRGIDLDASSANELESWAPTVDAGTGEGAALETDAAFTCEPLGAPCMTSIDCLCSKGSGCTWDNVTCRDGMCALDFKCDEAGVCDGSAGPLLPLLDAGDTCCSQCELNYDQGGTMAAWRVCAASCAAACPIRCSGE